MGGWCIENNLWRYLWVYVNVNRYDAVGIQYILGYCSTPGLWVLYPFWVVKPRHILYCIHSYVPFVRTYIYIHVHIYIYIYIRSTQSFSEICAMFGLKYSVEEALKPPGRCIHTIPASHRMASHYSTLHYMYIHTHWLPSLKRLHRCSFPEKRTVEIPGLLLKKRRPRPPGSPRPRQGLANVKSSVETRRPIQLIPRQLRSWRLMSTPD